MLRVAQDGTILYANEASGSLLVMWETQVDQKLPDTWQQVAADTLSTGESRTAEVECEGRIFSLTLAPIAEADYVNIYGRDVTNRKRGEEEIQSLADDRVIGTDPLGV